MTFTVDNRWSPGASGATIPVDTPAAYSARWVDQGDYTPADIVPDRQGFAFNDLDERTSLIEALGNEGAMLRTPHKVGLDQRDVSTVLVNHPNWACYGRRSGGYIYIDAWLKP